MAVNRADPAAGERDRVGDVGDPIRIPDGIDPAAAVVSYDAPSDTLFVHFGGRGRPAVSVERGGDLFALTDPATGELVGFQLEAFATRQLPAHPELVVAFDATELHGTTTDRVAAIRWRLGQPPAAPPPDPEAVRRALIHRLLADLAPGADAR